MTNLTRWDPFTDAMTLREAMNRLFEESFVPSAPAGRNGGAFVPALNLSENADAYQVELVVPGLKSEDLNITFENGVLTISGEVKAVEQQGRSYHRVERRYGRFSRSISLPATVRGDAIAAHLEAGLLTLDIPKAEEVKPRKITVNVG